MRLKVMTIFGTRPEAIKMAPVILRGRKDESFDIKVCVTGQHNEMLHQTLDFFGIRPDYDINTMKPDQSLFHITGAVLQGLEQVLISEKPDLVLVQGDATSAFVGALAAFYMRIPVAHIEAGLRSFNKHAPFPEEVNRVIVSHIADFHFAPTTKARGNLLREGIRKETIFVVGNTVVDALNYTLNLVEKNVDKFVNYFNYIDWKKPLLLVTCHRRESFGEPFKNICRALKEIAENTQVEIVYPVHLNPNVRKPVFEMLKGHENIHLIEPVAYPYLVYLMKRAYLILTDSGGIQEEAPGLGIPVLVMRDVTERIEGVEAGTCKLIGINKKRIVEETFRLLTDDQEYSRMSKATNPYGDGKSADRILSIIKEALC